MSKRSAKPSAASLEATEAQRLLEESEARRLRPLDTRNAIDLLFARAADSLTPGELRFLADATGAAHLLANSAAEVAIGIGCLVACDKEGGNFKGSDDVSSLMFHFAEVFKTIEGLGSLGAEAQRLYARQKGAQLA